MFLNNTGGEFRFECFGFRSQFRKVCFDFTCLTLTGVQYGGLHLHIILVYEIFYKLECLSIFKFVFCNTYRCMLEIPQSHVFGNIHAVWGHFGCIHVWKRFACA